MSNLNVPVTKQSRSKVHLTPGHSPLDWAHLKSSSNLRPNWNGPTRYSWEEIQKHNSKSDC